MNEMVRPRQSRLIVITGGPGSGKSTLIDALAREGYATVSEEAGRAIIRDQIAIGGTALPWADARLFAELMLSWEMRTHREGSASASASAAASASTSTREHEGGVIFLDRGVPDVIGYLKVIGMAVPPHMDAAARMIRYHPRVFIAPAWPEIYGQDSERKQTLEEAELTCKAMIDTYQAYDYELIELPKVSVAERVGFVLGRTNLDRVRTSVLTR